MSIDLRVLASRFTYVVGEDIDIGIEIQNRGTSTAQVPDPETNLNWQPVYELRGPRPSDVVDFDLRSVVRGKAAKPLQPSDAALIAIEPGTTHSASLSLGRLVPLGQPGSYTLSARLDWDGIKVLGSPAAFSLEPLVPRAFDVGLAWQQDGTPEIYAAWLHEARGKTVLFQGGFGEDRPDLGEVGRRSVARVSEPAAGVSQVFVPWAAHSRLDDLIGWVLWREGRELCGMPSMGCGPLRMTLPFVPSCWALPWLESRAHDIDGFIVGGPAARTLSMVRIRHNGFASAPAGAVVWSQELPEPVIAAAVCAQPNATERLRHLVLVSSNAGVLRVRYAIADGTTPPGSLQEHTLFDCLATPATPPAILADEQGGARVAVATSSPGDPLRCQLIELTFGSPQQTKQPPPVVASMVLPVLPREGQIRYHRHLLSGVFRRDCAIRGTDGATYRFGPTGGAQLVRVSQERPTPLSLVVLSNYSYLLERSASGAFQYEHV